jgi:hypothetical protein
VDIGEAVEIVMKGGQGLVSCLATMYTYTM